MERRARAVMVALAVGMIGSTAALAVPAVGGAAGGETPVTVPIGIEGPANFNFGFSPTRLPAGDPGATALRLAVEENTTSIAGVPPGVKEAKIGLDRSIRLDPGDLPVCRWPGLESGIQIQASGNDECPRAVVGHAEAAIKVAFPETPATIVSAKGTVYNGATRRGTTDLLVELSGADPLPGIIKVIVPIRPVRRGRIGSEATFVAPTLAGGSAVFLSLRLELRRGFRQDGERAGYVAAECPDGKLVATFAAALGDGTRGSEESIRACTPADRG